MKMIGESRIHSGWLFFTFAVLLSACTATTPAGPTTLVQLYTSRDGWYRVGGAQLQAAGVDVAEIDPQTFQLFHNGQETAIRVQGKAQNLMLDFYGQASDSPYSPYSVYQLRWARENGKRVPDVRMSSSSTAAMDSFQKTMLVTQPTLYVPQSGESGKRWFWQALTAPTLTTITLTLPSAVPGSAQFQVDLWGNSQDKVNPDHHVAAFLNNTSVADETWDGQGAHPLNFSVPVRAGENQLRLVLPGDTGAMADVVLLQSVQVTFTQRLVARNDMISFEGGRGSTRVEGFTYSAVDVFDITDPGQPQRVADASVAAGAVTFGSDSDGIRKWFAVGSHGYQRVERILPIPQGNLRERSRLADFIIVAHPDFVAALEPLVRWRTEHGLKPVVVTTQEIYTDYGFGEESPLALRAYLDALEPKPRFVLFVGKASYDLQNYLNAPNQNLVPTFLVDTLHLNQVASDNWFAAGANDPRPAFAVGRIPAKTPDQVKQVVDKIIAYESLPSGESWKRRALFIADDKDQAFADMAEALAGQAPKTIAPRQVYLKDRQGDVQAARDEILSDWNAGVFSLTYVGHGSIDTWAEGPLLSTQDLSQLKNRERLPILFTPTCLDGFFYHPQKDSLTEALLFKPDGGIVAGIAPTGVSVPDPQSVLMKQLFRELFDGGADTLGEAMLHAKQKMNAQDAEMREVIDTFGLLGDPALRIAR